MGSDFDITIVADPINSITGSEKMILYYLKTIIESGYYGKEQWLAWADNIILKNDVSDIEDWIFSVAIAPDVPSVMDAIGEGFEYACDHGRLLHDSSEQYYYGIEYDWYIGYYYLMYKEGRMGIKEMLSRFLDVDARYGDEDDPNSGYWYWKNNFEEFYNKPSLSESEILKLESLLAPFVENGIKAAEENKRIIESYMV